MFLHIGDLEQAERYLEGYSAKQTGRYDKIITLNLALGHLRLEGRVDDAKAHYDTCVTAFKQRTFENPNADAMKDA